MISGLRIFDCGSLDFGDFGFCGTSGFSDFCVSERSIVRILRLWDLSAIGVFGIGTLRF